MCYAIKHNVLTEEREREREEKKRKKKGRDSAMAEYVASISGGIKLKLQLNSTAKRNQSLPHNNPHFRLVQRFIHFLVSLPLFCLKINALWERKELIILFLLQMQEVFRWGSELVLVAGVENVRSQPPKVEINSDA